MSLTVSAPQAFHDVVPCPQGNETDLAYPWPPVKFKYLHRDRDCLSFWSGTAGSSITSFHLYQSPNEQRITMSCWLKNKSPEANRYLQSIGLTADEKETCWYATRSSREARIFFDVFKRHNEIDRFFKEEVDRIIDEHVSIPMPPPLSAADLLSWISTHRGTYSATDTHGTTHRITISVPPDGSVLMENSWGRRPCTLIPINDSQAYYLDESGSPENIRFYTPSKDPDCDRMSLVFLRTEWVKDRS